MTDQHEPDDCETPPTIEGRVQLAKDGGARPQAIVPFPIEPTPDNLRQMLHGKERRSVEELIARGYSVSIYNYRTADGAVIQSVLRFDHKAEPKVIRPLICIGKGTTGLTEYWFKLLDGPRPLYALDQLAARPEAPVLVVEGEKTADAAAARFKDHVAITWSSGSGNAAKNDLSPLTARHLVLWPDNDAPGRAAMRAFAAEAFEVGAASVKIVDVPPDLGDKWDLADEVPAAYAEASPEELLSTARPLSRSEVLRWVQRGQRRYSGPRLLGHPVGYSRVKPDDVEFALTFLDAGMNRFPWVEVGRSIFHAFGADGLPIFEAWSRTCPEKYRDGECGKMWSQFAQDPAFRGRPIAWLLALAQREHERRTREGNKPNAEISREARMQAAMEELNEDHAVVSRGDKTVVLWERWNPAFSRYTLSYLSKSDFENCHVGKVLLPEDDERQDKTREKRLQQGKLWFGSAGRRAYKGVWFGPGQDSPKDYLNSWRGFTVEPTDDPEGWSKLKEHLRDNVARGDSESYQYVLNWLAAAVQWLDRPIGTALVLVGGKGAGKSIITQSLAHLFGPYAFVTARLEDVTGRFNDRLEATLLLGLEEAVAANSATADSVIKDYLTRPFLRVEGKFFSIWDARNYLRIIITSNSPQVVRADASERRYAVFEVVHPQQHDPHARRRYFGKIVEQLETGGYGAMLGELLARNISGWNPEAVPDTLALRDQKQLSLLRDPPLAYWADRLQDGINIVSGDASPEATVYPWSETEEVLVPAKAVIDDYAAFTEAHGIRFSTRALATGLRRFMPPGFASQTVRPRPGDPITTPHRVYRIPPLPVARRLFEKATGWNLGWDPD